MTQQTYRVGRIGYRNVLPIYHPLESGAIPNSFAFTYGPPAKLNRIMAQGKLDLASMSSIEYARHPQRYYLLPDLGIGSCGPVMSVLLLSRIPIEDLDGRSILVSSETHTSGTLLRILFAKYLPMQVRYVTAQRSDVLAQGDNPAAVLAIGDEALTLRSHPDYPYIWDLGEVWRQWTGLPFVFGVWAARREFINGLPGGVEQEDGPCHTLLQAKQWGREHMDVIVREACRNGLLDAESMRTYFNGLVFDLGAQEQQGMRLFYEYLVEMGEIAAVPEFQFVPFGEAARNAAGGTAQQTGS